jgi:hypothetical protein
MPSGSVGIGTTTPLRKLQVQGDINYTGGLYLNNVLQIFASDTYAVTTSNVISTRITNLPQPNLTPYRLISDSYTKAEDNTFNTNNSNYTLNSSNNISLRITNLPQPNLTPYRLISDSYTIAQNNTQILNNSNYTTNTSNNLSNRLNNEVFSQWNTVGSHINYTAGKVGIGIASPTAGELHISETTGTVHSINTGTIILDHENNGGASSIVFRSKVNRTSDYGYIQYQDASAVGGSGESARLIIGIANDLDDHIILQPNLGNVGIGTNTPATKLHIQGDLAATGTISSFYSDERLKEDIKKIESPLNIIENLKGFYYKPNELAKSFGIKNDKREIGLSAQDVKRVLPEIVSLAPFDISRDSSNNIVSKSGEDYLTICYERMIPVIVEAIKELNNEIKELKRVNKELMENK